MTPRQNHVIAPRHFGVITPRKNLGGITPKILGGMTPNWYWGYDKNTSGSTSNPALGSWSEFFELVPMGTESCGCMQRFVRNQKLDPDAQDPSKCGSNRVNYIICTCLYWMRLIRMPLGWICIAEIKNNTQCDNVVGDVTQQSCIPPRKKVIPPRNCLKDTISRSTQKKVQITITLVDI